MQIWGRLLADVMVTPTDAVLTSKGRKKLAVHTDIAKCGNDILFNSNM